jgi:peptide/nickel transport system substrate-binding protein
MRRLCLAGILMTASMAAPLPAIAAQADNINVAVNQLPDGLDPAGDTGNTSIRVYYSVFDTLIRRNFGEDGQNGAGRDLVPALATSWEWTNPTTLEVKLRKDVVCHDGNPINADDVLATFDKDRLWGPKSYYPQGRIYFGGLKSVDKIDDYTVDFVSENPDPALEQRLASYTAFVICDEAWNAFKKPGVDYMVWMDEAANALRWHPVGTGPYMVEDYRNDDFVKLKAFDKAWEGQPAAKTITFRSVPEVAARLAGLVAGDYEMAAEIPPDQFDTIAGYDNLKLQPVVLENSHVLVFNMKDPLLSDEHLRHALSLAIDRMALIKALWKDKSFTPNGMQLPSFGALYDKDRVGYEYDPEKAKAELAKSSYKGEEISYRLQPNYYLYSNEAAQIMQEMWRAVGINVRLDFVESSDEQHGPGTQIYAWSNTFRTPEPTGSIIALYGPTSTIQTKFKFFDPPAEFNELSNKLAVETDPDAQRAEFQQLLDMFEQIMPVTFLYNPVVGYGMNSSIHFTPYAQYYMDFRPANFSIDD